MNLIDAIPGYREAIARERFVREAAFLPVNESIGGFEVLPMTWRHFMVLRIMRSPLLTGEDATPAELAAFLWVLSPEYTTDDRARDAFYKRCRVFTMQRKPRFQWQPKKWIADNVRAQVTFGRILVEARRYIEESLQDCPGKSKAGGFEIEYFSDAAWLCAHFGREFGWDDEQTLDKPLKRLWQYLKESSQHNGLKDPMFNPSDKVRGEWLARKQEAKCN